MPSGVRSREVGKSLQGNRVKQADLEAQVALKNYEQDQSPHLRSEMNRTAAELVLRLGMEEDFWKQKAAIRWVKQKREKSRIHSIEDEGQIISGDEELRASAVKFFQSLLFSDIDQLQEPDLEILSSLPPNTNMEALESLPTKQEVKSVVFGINADSASGPDSISSLFFQSCWDILGADVTKAVIDFFKGSQMPKELQQQL
ncbi:uncharacterized protein LOC121790125 [Salvia splendens]|uniref:uncharacterized protein LOC121790125 n=1 Tax=Salvia splendens TaxID=180675 RepID=UPI001C274953|nr:uncharacterized protein LOC121790125 [Salvia splendens]